MPAFIVICAHLYCFSIYGLILGANHVTAMHFHLCITDVGGASGENNNASLFTVIYSPSIYLPKKDA